MKVTREEVQRFYEGKAVPQAPPDTRVRGLNYSAIQRSVEQLGPAQVYKLIKQGTPIAGIAGALGVSPEAVNRIYRYKTYEVLKTS